MATRHQRRKASKAKREQRLIDLANAQRAATVAKIVRDNLSRPIERNYWKGTTSPAFSGTARPVSSKGTVSIETVTVWGKARRMK
jgi:hypothetical protein